MGSAAGDDDFVANQPASSLNSEGDSTASPQIDALSSILENLGMPPSSTNNGPSSSTTATPVTTTSGGTLTLADLQGAMAQISSTPSSLPLTDILNPRTIEESGILSNPETVKRLLNHLPDNQRSEFFLRENLHSPQCLETIKTLQSALRNSDNLHEILVNFNLDTKSLEQNNSNKIHPVELFLEAVAESVEKDQKREDEDGDDTKMEEG